MSVPVQAASDANKSEQYRALHEQLVALEAQVDVLEKKTAVLGVPLRQAIDHAKIAQVKDFIKNKITEI